MKIFLTGMMGSGKSYWMNRLGSRLHLEKYDLDRVVEQKEGKTIREIFEREGEVQFRKAESAALRQFASKDGFVMATGGGTPCFDDNMRWMNAQGLTIWIDEPIDLLVERILPQREQRPLIAGLNEPELRIFLEQKKRERTGFYEQAQLIICGDLIDEAALLNLIKLHSDA